MAVGVHLLTATARPKSLLFSTIYLSPVPLSDDSKTSISIGFNFIIVSKTLISSEFWRNITSLKQSQKPMCPMSFGVTTF